MMEEDSSTGNRKQVLTTRNHLMEKILAVLPFAFQCSDFGFPWEAAIFAPSLVDQAASFLPPFSYLVFALEYLSGDCAIEPKHVPRTRVSRYPINSRENLLPGRGDKILLKSRLTWYSSPDPTPPSTFSCERKRLTPFWMNW